MKFSIIIPVYNKQHYLALTLQSVLAQKWPDYEVLIIDDGSTDNSVAVIEQIIANSVSKVHENETDSKVKLIRQRNAGVAVARNNGIDHAIGEWVCFLDADDWYHPDYLAELAVMSDTYSKHNIIATRFVPMPDQPNWAPVPWVNQQRDYEFIESLPARWLKGIPFFTGSIAIKRNILLSMQPRFPAGESSGEDLDLWFRLAEKMPIVLLQQPLVVYRTQVVSGLSVTSHGSVNSPYLVRMALRANTLPTALKHDTLVYIAHFYITAARISAHQGNRNMALKLLTSQLSKGILIPRWWVSLFMILFLPATMIASWQKWRKSRTHAHIQ